MTLEELKKLDLPDEPGVYFFRGAHREILYIGKATSLRDRVRSYFSADLIKTRGPRLVDMVTSSKDVDFMKTDSVLEALILEANLIRKHQPNYNTKEKDNKSLNYVVFTNEDFPKVLIVRGRLLASEPESNYKYTFGPFPHGLQLKAALKILRRIFPYSDAKCVPCVEQVKQYHPQPPLKLRGDDPSLRGTGVICRPCFNHQIGLCPGVCTGEVSEAEYAETIRNLKLFFEGKKKALVKLLEKEMNDRAKKQEFEKAAVLRRTVFALTHIQDIALLKNENKIDESTGGEFSDRGTAFRIEAYDVAHISGSSVVGVMVVVEDEEVKKSDYRKFKIKTNPGVNDIAALKEIIRRRLGHLEWPLPNVLVVDGNQTHINAAEAMLRERGFGIDVVAVVKDVKHKPREIIGNEGIVLAHGRAILLANSEAHRFALSYHRQSRSRKFLS